jgi:ferredoxin-type protein NapH
MGSMTVNMSNKNNRLNFWRRLTQISFVFLLNPYFFTFRQVCFPVLNCWGCPISAFSCPIGAMGQFLSNGVFPFIVLGAVVVVGAVLGRMLCGWACPFGLLQDLLYKIKTVKIMLPPFLRYGKYLTLAIMVILIPLFFGINITPGKTTVSHFFFCNLCPAGTLEATLPSSFTANTASTTADANKAINQSFSETNQGNVVMSLLKSVRFWILIAFLVLFILISRPFCRVICPIGGMFALFNKISIYKKVVDKDKCTECDVCYKVCATDNKPYANPNSPECIRCLKCQAKCPSESIETQYF